MKLKKKYPNTIIINVYETKPVAILFKENSKYLLDSSSNLITFSENMLFDDLPSIFGEKAEQDFINFFDQLGNNNFPKQRVKNFLLFSNWSMGLRTFK